MQNYLPFYPDGWLKKCLRNYTWQDLPEAKKASRKILDLLKLCPIAQNFASIKKPLQILEAYILLRENYLSS
ncbi:hypothetical protein CMT22_17910 [Elizabethkingia anophelis]|nr:hypothetical protein [Elizabethkingia anophelis]